MPRCFTLAPRLHLIHLLTFALLAVMLLSLTLPSTARADRYDRMGCWELYKARNQFFKEKGLCFTRPEAIREFGNAGCSYDTAADLPISLNEKRNVERMVEAENQRGCARHGREGY